MNQGTSDKPPSEDKTAIISLKGPAVFSTDFGRYSARTHWKDQPVQIRSNYESDRAAFIASLRTKFPEPCMKLKQEDLAPATVLEYFDDYDIHFYSPTFLFEVLGYMARANDTDRAVRADKIESFVVNWIDTNRETFALLDPLLQWYHLFQQEDVDTHGFPFVWDAFRRIVQFSESNKNPDDKERLLCGKIRTSDSALPSAASTSTGKRYASAPAPLPVSAQLPSPDISFPSAMYHVQSHLNPTYIPHSLPNTVMSQTSQGRSTAYYGTQNATLTTVGGGPIIYQAPIRPLVPQQFIPVSRNLERAEGQGGYAGRNYKATRKDFHSDPLAQAWTSKAGYTKTFHAHYSSGNPGSFQYRRLPTTIRQRGFPPTHNGLHRGIRNPPKEISDDARANSDLSNNKSVYVDDDSPAWISASALPPDHGLSHEPYPRRPSRTSSFGAGGQLLDHRNRDLGAFRDVIQSQLSAHEPVTANMDKVASPTPRCTSNPFEMKQIVEKIQSPTHPEAPVTHRQQAPATMMEVNYELQEQKPPRPRTPPHTSRHPQPDALRNPLSRMPNAGLSQHNSSPQREDKSRFQLWVGNLLPQVTRSELVELFRHLPGFKDVLDPMASRYSANSEPKNRFTFVQFHKPEDVDTALMKGPDFGAIRGQRVLATRAKHPPSYDGRLSSIHSEPIFKHRQEALHHSRASGHHDAPRIDHLSNFIEQEQKLQEETDTSQVVVRQSDISYSECYEKPAPEDRGGDNELDAFQSLLKQSKLWDPEGHEQAAPKDQNVDIPSKDSLAWQVAVQSAIVGDNPPPSERMTVLSSGQHTPIKSFEESKDETLAVQSVQEKYDRKSNTKRKKGERATSQTSLPDTSQVQVPCGSAPNQVDASQDFPPLSSPLRQQRDVERSSRDHTVLNSITKSFAQVASQSAAGPGDGFSKIDKLGPFPQPRSQQLPHSREVDAPYQRKQVLTGSGAGSPNKLLLDNIASSKSVFQHESKSAVSDKGQVIAARSDVVVPKNSIRTVPGSVERSASQPTTRDSSIVSADVTYGTTPVHGISTGITTDAHASPRGSFEQSEGTTKNIEAVINAETGIDQEYLWHRLEGAANKSALSDSSDREQLLTVSTNQTASDLSVKCSPVHKTDPATSTPSEPKAHSRPTSPKQPEISVKPKAPSPPPPGPISTHKRKARSKPATPTKKTFQSISKSNQNQAQVPSSSPPRSPPAGRNQYPSIQSDLITVLMPPEWKNAAPPAPVDDQVVQSLLKPLQSPFTSTEITYTCQLRQDLSQRFTPPTLAQRLARLPLSPIADAAGEVLMLNVDDRRVLPYVDLAKLHTYKLNKLRELTRSRPEIARAAEDWLSKSPLGNPGDASTILTDLMAWNTQAGFWIESLPQSLIFDDSMSQELVDHIRRLEPQIREIQGDFLHSQVAGSFAPGSKGAALLDRAAELLDCMTQNHRLPQLVSVEMDKQMNWVMQAFTYLDCMKQFKSELSEMIPHAKQRPPGDKERNSTSSEALHSPDNVVAVNGSEPFAAQMERVNGLKQFNEADQLKMQIAIGSAQAKLRAEMVERAEKRENAEKGDRAENSEIAGNAEKANSVETTSSPPSKVKSKSKSKSENKAKFKTGDHVVPKDLQPLEQAPKSEQVKDDKTESEASRLGEASLEYKQLEKVDSNERKIIEVRKSIPVPTSPTQQRAYLPKDRLHNGLTENAYIYETSKHNFLAEEPLFGATGNIWDHVPPITPWGPTNMDSATRMLKQLVQSSSNGAISQSATTEASSQGDEKAFETSEGKSEIKSPDGKGAISRLVSEATRSAAEDDGQTVIEAGQEEAEIKSVDQKAGLSQSVVQAMEPVFKKERENVSEIGERKAETKAIEKNSALSPPPTQVKKPTAGPSSSRAVSDSKDGKDAWRVPSNEPVWGSNLRGGKKGGVQTRGGARGGRKGRA